MDIVNPPRRAYRSPLRATAAQQTRQTMVAAATQLFLERGYAGTPLTAIAEQAGVARPTVFATFGSKAALLKEAVDQALAGDDEDVPVAQRPWFTPVWEATTPADVLRAYAHVCTLIGARAAGLFDVVRSAAHESVEAHDLWTTLQANRRAGAATVVDHVLRMGPVLSPELTRERAIDLLWLLNDPAHHLALVWHCGWDEKEFSTWLAQQMISNLTA
ncbi:MAG: helix-turn-helix domain-containing protein [Actinomycetes bacterium]